MKITVIVPSNSNERIIGFLQRYSKLTNFKKIATLAVIGNGEVESAKCERFIRYDEKSDIIHFTRLRGIAMEHSLADFFLFLDDDHIFEEGADDFLMNCVQFLKDHKECGILQLESERHVEKGFHIKRNAHVWTSRGLFIKNIKDKFLFKEYYKLFGACEDLLYGYEVLAQSYLPYCTYDTPIKRGCKLPNNHKELNDPSYSEELLDKNIIGYIKNKFNHDKWIFYGKLKRLGYPNSLRHLIKSRLTNLI